MVEKVNITPEVASLSVFENMSYKAWVALGEFVDNSIQSYLDNKSRIYSNTGRKKLTIQISVSSEDGGEITIQDNAAGINDKDMKRAFRVAARPTNNKGLSEFGMGMKVAACWFSRNWEVATKALNEDSEKVVKVDIKKITSKNLAEVDVKRYKAKRNESYTIITLRKLLKKPEAKTIPKIKTYLALIYRNFINDKSGNIEIFYNQEKLKYNQPKILKAPHYLHVEKKVKNPKIKEWRKKINIKYKNIKVTGFAAIREEASTSQAGFSLFRRGRIIHGGGDQTYRPPLIFKNTNSFEYQRVFGELHFSGLDVSFTKDRFLWTPDDEEMILGKLLIALDSEPLPILKQAKKYRKNKGKKDFEKINKEGLKSTIRRLGGAINTLDKIKNKEILETKNSISEINNKASESKTFKFDNQIWKFDVIMSYEKYKRDWLVVEYDEKKKKAQIIISMSHNFTETYFGDTSEEIEGLQLIAMYLGLSELHASLVQNVKSAGRIRRTLNDIMRELH